MFFPRRMKYIELTVHKNDINPVLEYLGSCAAMHFPDSPPDSSNAGIASNRDALRIGQNLEKLKNASLYIGLEPDFENKGSVSVSNEERQLLMEKIISFAENLKQKESGVLNEKTRIKDTLSEIEVFSRMNIPYDEFTHLSYITLRAGRLDPKNTETLRENLKDRAVIVPLDDEGRILAVSSRKGRFALDAELEKQFFETVKIPEDYKGIPSEIFESLDKELKLKEKELENILLEKNELKTKYAETIKSLINSLQITQSVETIKSKLIVSGSVYVLSGWVPHDITKKVTIDLLILTEGRVAIHSYNPDEIPSVRDGEEKVPVSLKHGAFVKGFEGMVSSFGMPQYGTIDPTAIVAFFYTVIFGIMFGDVGHGFVLFLLGFLASSRGLKSFSKFKKYSVPLMSVGIASMIMGVLNGAVFTNEYLLVSPTRIISAAITGYPADRILHILPMTEKGGSMTKLFYFFGFTIGIGIVLNTLGILINIFNSFVLKKYKDAVFSKKGLCGLVLFWYTLFIVFRCAGGGGIEWYDITIFSVSFLCILFAPVINRCIERKKPAMEHGVFTFVIEIIVEIIETSSTFFSNTISFVRVGAFALSHAVLSYVVFYFSETLVLSGGAFASFSAALLMIFGNSLIIVLEGLIVAIQVVRLQYYEFFGKFFFQTGIAFSPFRLRNYVEKEEF